MEATAKRLQKKEENLKSRGNEETRCRSLRRRQKTYVFKRQRRTIITLPRTRALQQALTCMRPSEG